MPAVRWEATPDMGLHMLKTWVLSFSGRFLLVVTPSSAMEGVCQPLTEQLHGASGCLPVCLSVDVSARARALCRSLPLALLLCVWCGGTRCWAPPCCEGISASCAQTPPGAAASLQLVQATAQSRQLETLSDSLRLLVLISLLFIRILMYLVLETLRAVD